MSILCEFSSVAPPQVGYMYMYMSIAVSSGVVSYIVYVNITTGEAGMLGIVSYPDPYVRNDDHRLQYDITYRGSGNKVVRNGSSATECCCTNQIAAICDVDIPMLWPSANCISSMPIVKPLPKVRRD